MSINFGSDIGLQSNSFSNILSEIQSEFSRISDGFHGKYSNITNQPPKENVYVDDGFANVPGTSFYGSSVENFDDVKKRKIITQKPDATVYIKKRLFWSLRNEHDTKFMDPGEKLFIRASKLLFERKCLQIAAYESMTKLSQLIDEESELDAEQIKNITDYVDSSVNSIVSAAEQEFKSIAADSDKIALLSDAQKAFRAIKQDAAKITMGSLRKLEQDARKTRSATTTSWVIDTNKNVDVAKVGRGVGVIEFTMVDSLSTSLSLEYGDLGSVSLSIEDPYNLMKVTADDVEIALRAAYREIDAFNFNEDTLSAESVLDMARRKDEQLKRERSTRNMFGVETYSGITPNIGEISFQINISSSAQNKVTGMASGLNETFNINNYNIVLLKLPSEYRLTSAEDDLVRQIFTLLNQYVDKIVAISSGNKLNNNDLDIKYARRQLRLHYVGKNIIQPMDGINIYLRGRTSGNSDILGPLNGLLNNSWFIGSFADNQESSDAVLQEEMKQFGLDKSGISIDLYRTLRTGSLLRNAGTHVFGGLISSVTESYSASSGKYTLNVSGESNMKWLTISRVNTAPSLDQPQGLLEDPITPLDMQIDEATGLIIGTPGLSTENRKRKLYYNSGVYKGEEVLEENIDQDIVTIGNSAYSKKRHAPGLVYKWKQGVITATRNINMRTKLNGDTYEIDQLRRDVGVRVTADPFANLDIADVVSLLVTGFPHNYESFFINAQSVGTFTPGGSTNNPESYFHSFFDITRSTNRALGNFQPFKTINIDRKQMAKRLDLQTDLVRNNEKIKELQSKIAQKYDEINSLSSSYIEIDQTKTGSEVRRVGVEILKAEIERLKKDLTKETTSFTEKIKDNKDLGLRIYGDDIILEYSDETEASENKKLDDAMKKIKTRSKLMQLRPQLSTKFNTDTNLFIVSDDYDKDLDLQAFIISLNTGEMPIWNSSYQQPRDICINAAKVIDYELFTDTQGNIQFRSPRYNKVPLSLLLKMMLLSENSIDVFPPFIKSLFSSRQKSLEDSRDALDLEIRINSLLLFGKELTDDKLFGRVSSVDMFLSNIVENTISTGPSEDKSLVQNIRELRNKLSGINGSISSQDSSEEEEKISKEIKELQDPKSANVNSNRLNVINKLIQLSSQKQRVVDTINKMSSRPTQQNYSDLLKRSKKDFRVNVGAQSALLEPFGDLIEDDYNDFIGPGSSKRFIIYDEQLIEYKFDESDRNVYCRVDVTGQEDMLGGNPGEIGNIPLIWAGATDFDLWKQYGWRAGENTNKPFFKDAETQCAPYALMLLSRQRRDVVKGSITVAGNEYYQLGDVVYINSRDMLYYVYAIRQRFSYSSGQYTTELDLRYGHPLGEFIPTPLDVIGKNLIKNQRKFNTTFMFRKTASSDMGRLIDTITFRNVTGTTSDQLRKMLIEGDLGSDNLTRLKNSLSIINSQIGKNIKIDIRGYVFNDSEKTRVFGRMEAVRDWLLRPISGLDSDGNEILLDGVLYSPIDSNKIYDLSDEDRGPINMSNLSDFNKEFGRIPSEETWNLSSDSNSLEYFVEIALEFLN